MSGPGSSSSRGFWSRAARPVVALSAAGGFVLALPFMAVPASAAPADAGVFANPAHEHATAAHAATTAAVKAAPALSASAPAHTFHPVAGAPDAPQDPLFLDSGQCHSLAGGICTLRAAVQEANAEASYIAIALTSGTYNLTIPPANTSDASTGNLDITDPQTVTFTGAGIAHTFIDAAGMGDRVFQLEGNAVARMTGLTIQNGNAQLTSNNTDQGYGGGIDESSAAAALVLQSVRLTTNTAVYSGGGVYVGGSAWVTGSQLTNNSAGYGAGLYSYTSVQLVNDTVTGNTASIGGGGVYVDRGAAAIQGGSVSGNHVVFDGGYAEGGGIYAGNATTIVGTTINNNTIAPSSTATSGSAQGGGLFVSYGLDRADHLTIRGNSVTGLTGANYCFGDAGGGIYDYYGFTLTNSVISGNKAPTGNGGGVCNYGDTERLTHVTVSGNSAGIDGGGLYAYDVTYVSKSTITNNTAGGNGGGFWSDDGQQLDQSLIAGNHAVHGAGIWTRSPMLLTNDTLTGNVAGGTGNAGGALYNADSGTVQLTNVTIAANRSDDGGGIAQFGGGVTVHNTIIANNRANGSSTDTNCDVTSSGATPLTDAGHNIDSGHTCGLSGPGSRSNTNPQLGALANNGGPTKTMALLSGSPAIGHGSSPAPSVDQRGVKRDSPPDIGAFEKE